MTAPSPTPPASPPRIPADPTPWWTKPAIVLPAVGALAFVAALFSPVKQSPRGGDPRLSSLSTAPLGASLAYELADRLGWDVERRLRNGIMSDRGTILAVLDPAIPLRANEVHALLEHVRAGGGAYVVAGASTGALMDSLHLAAATAGAMVPVEAKSRSCKEPAPQERLNSLWFGAPPQMRSLRWTAPPPPEPRVFVTITSAESKDRTRLRDVVVGFGYGAGRLVVSVDPDVLRNDAMRDCAPGLDIAFVRALEFLRDGGDVPRRRLVFDEYHQAHGAHPGTVSAAALYLRDLPTGRLLAQLALAGLILLLALAPRTVPPRHETRVERRSPLEQVDALARAYAQVGATRTAAARLVRGTRRRTERGLGRDRRTRSDDEWLARIAERHPALADDVALARRALADALPSRTFATLGPALHRIEATLTDR